MDITESDTKALKLEMTEKIWLRYFNDVLRVRGIITLREYMKMESKIAGWTLAKKIIKSEKN